ncbi:MAG TPA: NADH-quinone oxidoreductase subunit N [Terracidiphilus sp.]|jgi:NADH-quinone oxidoreductase subunit N
MNYADLFRVTLPETILEITALLVLVIDLGLLRKTALNVRLAVAASLGVIGCGAALVAVAWQGVSWLTIGDNSSLTLLGTGGFIAVSQIGILVLTALTLLLLFDSVFTKHIGEFVAVILMAAAGGLLIAGAQDLLVIFIGLELLSLGLYILTAFAKSSGKSAEGALKYYLFGGMSAAFLLFGFSYFYGLTGTTNLALIQYRITLSGPSPLFYVAWILVLAGLGFKVAAVPFHLWAPDAYEGAPAPAAAFIASVSKVASFALLITLAMNWWLHPGGSLAADGYSLEQMLRAYDRTWPQLGTILLIAAAASMVVGNLAALAQVSVRRLLAYSAIAHAGYILLGLAAHPTFAGEGTAVAFNAESFFPALRSIEAVLFYVLTYGLTTVGAFGVVAVVERSTGSDKFDSFLGLHKRNPLLAGVLLVLFLSLAGIPPLVGFWAKFNLFAAVLGEHAGAVPFALVCLAIAMSAVSLYYYLQILKRAYVMPAVDETPIKVHPVVLTVLVAIAAAVLALGCFPTLLGGWIGRF